MSTQQTRWLLLVSFLLTVMGMFLMRTYPPQTVHQRVSSLEDSLAIAHTHLVVSRQRVDRQVDMMRYADQYGISNELSGRIIRAADEEGIGRNLAFRLVWRESRFNQYAVSEDDAIGLTQILPSTARIFQKNISRQALFQPDRNLRLGFRYLHRLIRRYDGDVYLALSAFHQGPTRLASNLQQDRNPSHEYATEIMSEQ